ncbi:hypothetical protein CH373_17915 [Leptospira perolatii]|uniref:YCII-related domain-containing protein n=1 Tax=Leptospira perolatii TaxID=2023191 RepID=A0A2M9ZI53_9LEPT|nr:YciI family protein [Leptospira perolatii]PJZ68124.1 hypothetical protein CH360_17860 [Leptospira perolatii]PJZ71745.1 hypothetical protein CH373_17915 [Leptospira perolatii]
MMKKYLFLSVGFEKPTQEIMQAWGKWFSSIKDRLADSGGHFAIGREVTRKGTIQLPLDLNSITGYIIVNAENMDQAEEIARNCPIITSLKIFEIMSAKG